MNKAMSRVLWGFVLYEVVAYAWNSYKVSQPSAAGAAVTGLLPFDLISNFVGYATPSNPSTTAATAVSGYLGAYMPRRVG